MNEHDPILKIRFEGAAVGLGKIPVAHLLRFLSNLNRALQRTGRVLLGDAESVRRGRQPHNVSEEMADVRALFGSWPGEEDDGFEAAIDELRRQSVAGGGLS